MSATSLSRRTRRQYALTPPFVPDDDEHDGYLYNGEPNDPRLELFRRSQMPPLVTDAAIPPLQRPPQSIVPSRPELTAAPPVEFGQPYGTVPTLARPPLHDIDRIAALGEENPLPTAESDIPLLSRTPQMPPPVRSMPRVYNDESNHPAFVFGGDSDEERLGAKRRSLEAYQPQKESKKSLALRTILNFVGGGIPGAVGTLIGPAGVLDRRGKDRAWQQEQLGQVYGQLDRSRADRRAGLQDDYLQSQIDENKAQTVRALQPPIAPPVKPAAERTPLRQSVTLPDGSTKVLLSFDNGKTWDDRPELRGAPKPSNDPTPEQIDQAIGQIEAEQKTLGPSPPTEIPDVNQWGEPIGKKTNPAYLDWARRYRELNDKKRDLQMKRKTPPTLTRGSVSAPPTFITAFKKKHGREPTQAEIEAYAQAANAR